MVVIRQHQLQDETGWGLAQQGLNERRRKWLWHTFIYSLPSTLWGKRWDGRGRAICGACVPESCIFSKWLNPLNHRDDWGLLRRYQISGESWSRQLTYQPPNCYLRSRPTWQSLSCQLSFMPALLSSMQGESHWIIHGGIKPDFGWHRVCTDERWQSRVQLEQEQVPDLEKIGIAKANIRGWRWEIQTWVYLLNNSSYADTVIHWRESRCAILSPCQPVAKLVSLFRHDRWKSSFLYRIGQDIKQSSLLLCWVEPERWVILPLPVTLQEAAVIGRPSE